MHKVRLFESLMIVNVVRMSFNSSYLSVIALLAVKPSTTPSK